jgi:hypothetical protein
VQEVKFLALIVEVAVSKFVRDADYSDYGFSERLTQMDHDHFLRYIF